MKTGKENQIDSLRYLTHALEQLALIDSAEETALDALIPWSEEKPSNCRIPKKPTVVEAL